MNGDAVTRDQKIKKPGIARLKARYLIFVLYLIRLLDYKPTKRC